MWIKSPILQPLLYLFYFLYYILFVFFYLPLGHIENYFCVFIIFIMYKC